MTARQRPRIDRAAAEGLLRRAATDRPAGPEPLADLLGAAADQGRAGRVLGEDAVMTAFRQALLQPPTEAAPLAAARSRRLPVTTILTRLFTLKALAIACAATTAGGFALAAGSGHLPPPIHLPSRAPHHHHTNVPHSPGPVPSSPLVRHRPPGSPPQGGLRSPIGKWHQTPHAPWSSPHTGMPKPAPSSGRPGTPGRPTHPRPTPTHR